MRRTTSDKEEQGDDDVDVAVVESHLEWSLRPPPSQDTATGACGGGWGWRVGGGFQAFPGVPKRIRALPGGPAFSQAFRGAPGRSQVLPGVPTVLPGVRPLALPKKASKKRPKGLRDAS